ncbi:MULTISPECIES: hypothetical protein [Cyanophyceae]|uniref:hypothetical protein n=1 Tax=Cyanophyceae TaxID=3028117 RepID=UPI0028C44BBD|nr:MULTISPECIES: hypothetical protein [unclassified Phormidium]
MRRNQRRLYRGLLFWLALVLSYCLSHAVPPSTVAQAQSQIFVNQASAQFVGPNGPATTVSNQTEVSALMLPGPPPGPELPLLQITKTADRAAAEPGDVAIYRLLVTNLSTTQPATPLTITDQLPLGLLYVPDSVQATPQQPTQVVTTDSSLTLTFASLGPGESVSVAYGVLLTPDAVRGGGRNIAQASAPGFTPVTAAYQMTIRPGILADCGTILGRVFVDKNFDGQQQPGEAGVPNAVIFMDDGNRILTDPDGLFSLANVLPGYRVGTLDLYSLPGYTLAPNLYRIEENSASRFVRLSPGGLGRMNFAVTPTFGEEQS